MRWCMGDWIGALVMIGIAIVSYLGWACVEGEWPFRWITNNVDEKKEQRLISDRKAGDVVYRRKRNMSALLDCIFLEKSNPPAAQGILCCSAGINFYAVGDDRAVCRRCPLGQKQFLPDCEHLDVAATLKGERVKLEIRCLWPENEPDDARCTDCPLMGNRQAAIVCQVGGS